MPATPFIGQVIPVPYNFAPRGWAFCQGQLLSIAQNAPLFSLLGTQFGGDGRTTFALPNLQGIVAIHQGQGPGLSAYNVGQTAGSASVALNQSQLPAHNHNALAFARAGATASPAGACWARPASDTPYGVSPQGAMGASAIAPAGGGSAHENQQPYLVLNFIIALQGIFPSRN
jgi:microcystin-dependent protein